MPICINNSFLSSISFTNSGILHIGIKIIILKKINSKTSPILAVFFLFSSLLDTSTSFKLVFKNLIKFQITSEVTITKATKFVYRSFLYSIAERPVKNISKAIMSIKIDTPNKTIYFI